MLTVNSFVVQQMEQLYSRQIGTYGEETMKNIKKLRIRIKNLTAAGCEIVKNLCLSGVKKISIEDSSAVDEVYLGRNYMVSFESIGMRKDEASLSGFRELNPLVEVSLYDKDDEYDVFVVLGEYEKWPEYDVYSREKHIWFIGVDVRGTFGVLWENIGEKHEVYDVDGEKNVRYLCVSVNGDNIDLDSDHLQFEIGDVFQVVRTGMEGRICSISGKSVQVVDAEVLQGDYINRLPKRVTKSSIPLLGHSKTFDNAIGEEFTLETYLTEDYDTEFYPLSSFLGGVVSQEVLKFVGKYVPMTGLTSIYFGQENKRCTSTRDRYYDVRSILGEEEFETLRNHKVFLVGAGALGCESLKNMAMLGVGTGERGTIYVTDMDKIELSNLNRQFLFRKEDIGKWKSETASEKVLKMNRDLKITPSTLQVGKETKGHFNDSFWGNLDFVVNALDNVEARKYVDSLCRWYKKPLYESGTLGTKANFQLVYPDKTETYGDTTDPPEKDVPVCTIKSFPYQIEHCIQWSREHLEYIISELPVRMKKALRGEREELSEIELVLYKELRESTDVEKVLLRWSELYLENLFIKEIEVLQNKHPKNSLLEDGTLFWSGKKRFPMLTTTSSELFVLCQIETIAQLHRVFDTTKGKMSDTKINVLEFDKDDDSNGQIDWILRSTNLRAETYGIPLTDKNNCQQVAGKITPAICTTTSAIVGRVFSEICFRRFKNMFMNSALNIYVESDVFEPVRVKSGFNDILQSQLIAIPENHSYWDRIFITKGLKTLRELKEYVESEYKITVTNIFKQEDILYNEFMTDEKKSVLEKELSEYGRQYQLDGEDSDYNIVVLPPVVLTS
jgi:ubiquitin-activating enzyme E1